MVRIELNKVTFAYQGSERSLFAEFSLTIAAGEWVALVGPSGAGKTTLLKLIKGLLQAQTGAIKINGASLHAGELNHLSACVFANPENQIVSPVVAEDVAFGLENDGLTPELVSIRVEEALHWVGLRERAWDFSHLLSGGQQQLLILAGAVALRKGCLLLDDPLSMVDAKARTDMLQLLGDIHRQDRCTLVHTTHLLEEALVAQRVVAVDEGRVLFDGSPRGLLAQGTLLERLGLEVPEIAQFSEMLVSSGVAEARGTTSVEQLLGLLNVSPCSES